MKKIIGLVVGIAVVVALVGTGTWALFSDTEQSVGNQMTAGVIDLEIDCAGDTTFSAQDDVATSDDPSTTSLPKIFDYLPTGAIEPGDSGEVTLSLHLKADIPDGNGGTVDSENADLWMAVRTLVDYGGANPESETAGDDVISDAIEVLIWLDEGATTGWQGTGTDSEEGDNTYQDGETILFGDVSTPETLYDLWDECDPDGKLTVVEDAVACTTYYVGFSWELPDTVSNEAQGDYCTFDIVFGGDQIVD